MEKMSDILAGVKSYYAGDSRVNVFSMTMPVCTVDNGQVAAAFSLRFDHKQSPVECTITEIDTILRELSAGNIPFTTVYVGLYSYSVGVMRFSITVGV